MVTKMVAMEVLSVAIVRSRRFRRPQTWRRRRKRYNSARLTAPLSRKMSGPMVCSTTGTMKIVKQKSERKKRLSWKERRAKCCLSFSLATKAAPRIRKNGQLTQRLPLRK